MVKKQVTHKNMICEIKLVIGLFYITFIVIFYVTFYVTLLYQLNFAGTVIGEISLIDLNGLLCDKMAFTYGVIQCCVVWFYFILFYK